MGIHGNCNKSLNSHSIFTAKLLLPLHSILLNPLGLMILPTHYHSTYLKPIGTIPPYGTKSYTPLLPNLPGKFFHTQHSSSPPFAPAPKLTFHTICEPNGPISLSTGKYELNLTALQARSRLYLHSATSLAEIPLLLACV